MTQKSLSRWLKAVIIVIGVAGALIYGFLWYFLGMPEQPGQHFMYLTFWMIMMGVCAIPCYAALVLFWKIARNIGLDRSFSLENARHLRTSAFFALVDTAIVFVVNIAALAAGISRLAIFIALCIIVALGLACVVVFAALSHLVMKAAKIKEENDLTI